MRKTFNSFEKLVGCETVVFLNMPNKLTLRTTVHFIRGIKPAVDAYLTDESITQGG